MRKQVYRGREAAQIRAHISLIRNTLLRSGSTNQEMGRLVIVVPLVGTGDRTVVVVIHDRLDPLKHSQVVPWFHRTSGFPVVRGFIISHFGTHQMVLNTRTSTKVTR